MLAHYYLFHALDIARERRAEADRHRLAVLAATGRTAQHGLRHRAAAAVARALGSVAEARSSADETSRGTPALGERGAARQ